MAVQRSTHPSADTLKAFGLGKLDDSSSGVVIDHLDQCQECRNIVAELSGDDFLQRLRQARSRSSTPAPAKSLAEIVNAEKSPASQTPIPNLPPELANNPHYEILRELGRGGMGVVYLAHNKLMDRREVLKVVNKTLLDHPGAVERFLREIRAAAKLNHANVVAAYSAVQQGELLAFAMEYVEGQDLASSVKSQGPLPIANACFYVQQAAWGLQHAYEKQMVHRDIKPQNLILAREGKKHVVKVLDFGLAKVLREKTDDTGLTGEGRMLGTPDYIAPEQTLDAAKADIRADIYSLGCTLYFLLSGRPPFSANSLGAILLAHQMQEAKLLNLVRPEVPEELASVVRKMMAKSPTQRYQTPREVAQALAPFIKPAVAPKSAPELSIGEAEPKPAVKKAARVDPPSVPPEPPDVEESPKKSSIPSDGSRRNERFSELTIGSALGQSIPNVAPRKRRTVRNRRPATGMTPTRKKWLMGGGIAVTVLLLALLGMWAAGVFKVKTRDGTLELENLPADAEVTVDGEKVTVNWSGDGQKAVIRVRPGTRKVEVTKNGFTLLGEEVEIQAAKQRVLTVRLVPPTAPGGDTDHPLPDAESAGGDDRTGGFRFVHFGKDGTRVLLLFHDDKQKKYFAQVYDLASGQALTPPLQHEARMTHVSFSPDGKRVLTASQDKTARLWDAGTGQALTPPLQHGDSVSRASFSPDGKRVVTASYDKTARLWDAGTGQVLTPPLQHEDKVSHASFSPDGQRVVTASQDKTARLWDAATGKEVTPPLRHARNAVIHATFSPDGRRVVTASWDSTARVWDAATGRALTPPLQHKDALRHASFSPDGRRVVTASKDETARVWDAATGKEVTPPLQHEGGVMYASFSPDGQHVITAAQDKTARLWDAATGQALTPPLHHEGVVHRAAFSPDGRRVVTAGQGKTSRLADVVTERLWDVATGKQLKKVTLTPDAVPVAQADGFIPVGLPHEAWRERIKSLPVERVPDAVADRLRELNPGFDGKIKHAIEKKQVVSLEFVADAVRDISPVQALSGLRKLHCRGSWFRKGKIADLSPLQGLKLTELFCDGNPQVTDLSPLRGMPLTRLFCANTEVTDLSPLKGMNLMELDCGYSSLRDLSPLKEVRLTRLHCYHCKVTDASLVALQQVPGLRNLELAGEGITDAGLAHISKIPDLEHFEYGRAKFTGAGLMYLKEMTKLRHLKVFDAPVKDNALVHVKGLIGLREFGFDGTHVSDAGLKHLTGLKNLVWLDLRRTRVTDKGVAKLKEALPKCRMIR